MNWIVVAAGAALGASLRYGLHLWCNPSDGRFAWGTLWANLIGAYAAGLLLAWFAQTPQIPAAWRLFAMTGVLGGLTTFSTFSVEALQLLQRGSHALAFAHVGAHVAGSIALCFAGYMTLHR